MTITLSPRQDVKVQLLKFLEDKDILLVLDNFEHLIAKSGVTELITELLELSPNLKLIITSRERLSLSSEWLVDIEGLSYPKDADTTDIAAVVNAGT